jgi:hypothetical protein
MHWGVAVPSNQIEVSLGISSVPYQISQSSHHDPYSSAEEQASEKPHEYESQQGPERQFEGRVSV